MLQPREENYKRLLLELLNSINGGWVDGDKQPSRSKKVDIVNDSLKFAIEVKDDTKVDEKYSDLPLINWRYRQRIQSANNKFKEYPNYKTLLVIRTKHPVPKIIYCAISGCDTYRRYGNHLIYSGKDAALTTSYNQIGGFLFYSCPPGIVPKYYYYQNPYALSCRRVRETDKVAKRALE